MDPDAAAEVIRAAGVDPIDPIRVRGRFGDAGAGPASAWWRRALATCAPGTRPALAALSSRTRRLPLCAAGLEPLGPFPGAARPWPCRCAACGRESQPRYATLSNGTTCRYCGVERAKLLTRRACLRPLHHQLI